MPVAVRVLDICLVALALYLVVYYIRRRSAPLPPGPSGWLFIGSLLDIRRSQAMYKTFGAMSSKYGPIICLNVLGKHYVFLNSRKAAKDLLDKEGAITSNRPRFTMGGELVGWGNNTGFLQYGDALRKHRKLSGQHIGTKNRLEAFYPVEEAEAKKFVLNVLKNPDDLPAHCRSSNASLILKVTYGYSVKEVDDPLVEISNIAMRNISQTMTPGRYLVDSIPMMRYLPEWFPGCSFLKDAKVWRKMVNDAVSMPFEFVLEHLAKGDAVPSFTSRLLQEGIPPEDQEILKWASFTMFLAGSNGTPHMLLGFFLAMTMYPDVFKRAQAEVDAVVGSDRLPNMDDRDALPYVSAVCSELFRWNVLVPLTSHVNTQDIIYEGYTFPKGTYLIGNMWFLLSDPETYPDPDRFDPERFLGENPQPDPREICFGWGRRQCTGTRMVDSVIFIYVATALASLDISRYVEDGVEQVPKYEFDEGILRRIKPFKCKVVPRSRKAEGLLHA